MWPIIGHLARYGWGREFSCWDYPPFSIYLMVVNSLLAPMTTTQAEVLCYCHQHTIRHMAHLIGSRTVQYIDISDWLKEMKNTYIMYEPDNQRLWYRLMPETQSELRHQMLSLITEVAQSLYTIRCVISISNNYVHRRARTRTLHTCAVYHTPNHHRCFDKHVLPPFKGYIRRARFTASVWMWADRN